jgi:hypothetical protein
MFPSLPEQDVQDALSRYGIEEAAQVLIDEKCSSGVSEPAVASGSSSSSSSQPQYGSASNPIGIETEVERLTLEHLLHHQADKMLDNSSEYTLRVDRSTADSLWLSVMSFYKSSLSKSYKIRRELVVDFQRTGEVGADSGALRKEFFEGAIEQANARLLEGEDERRVLKKDWGMELEYESFGTLVAHSILQEGPGIPCLSPCAFQYLIGEDTYPVKEDIPLNMATHQLISFIEEVSTHGTVIIKLPYH